MYRKITVVDRNALTSGSIIETVEEICIGDLVIVDVPLFIRLLEYAREDASNDVDLHVVAEKIVDMIIKEPNETLTMEDYNDIIGKGRVLTEKSFKFRMDVRTLWSRFAWSLLNYSISLTNELDGKEQAEAKIYAHADKIGQAVVPYYGPEVGTTLANALKEFGKIGVKAVQDVKAGIPPEETKKLMDSIIVDISKFLSSLNPEAWPEVAVKSYFDMLASLWVDTTAARATKDWAGNDIITDNIDKLVTSGSGDVVSLADVFSEGIVSQYPDKFKD